MIIVIIVIFDSDVDGRRSDQVIHEVRLGCVDLLWLSGWQSIGINQARQATFAGGVSYGIKHRRLN
jgi:hypothetical protein